MTRGVTRAGDPETLRRNSPPKLPPPPYRSFRVGLFSFFYLVKLHRPSRELVEHSSFRCRARLDRLREDMEMRRFQSLSNHLQRNSVHEQFQKLVVLQISVLKGPSIPQADVEREVELRCIVAACRVVVIPGSESGRETPRVGEGHRTRSHSRYRKFRLRWQVW